MKMRYASVNGVRQEAQPKLRGACLNCNRDMVAKCGQQRIWHWSHVGKLECDHWWEAETEWHRMWKDKFPREWQEVPHIASDGERHIADVKSGTGWVVELQHSPISPEERVSRENFYGQMVWVVDGLRHKRDLGAFRRAVIDAPIIKDAPLYLDPFTGGAAIFQRWTPIQRPVFIDFGDEEFHIAGFSLNSVLWQLLLRPGTRTVVVAAVTRASFVEFCLSGSPMQNIVAMRGR
ncbi:MAG: hypothetical protein E5Y51_05595 [Mesorhizobium sp.]|uniref:competence protein CoiA n=1 Tax=Mesorhizobium sp. M1A.F.Ca.IN.022.06.1.1 TaxID=2493680 RepID=UPI000F755794|nr:competence protein CoiA family protein [Mesorhizobium sp. M1A.F.Ca.IN.022.06.1.1]AZO61224.1 hypothetical protein EJ078_19665 [Mesorhizobium sp. M1A.F.Ca.IN.022.06.1.1]TIN19675.1 MAG: hypothetical protein E5Y51_05595 [Mesorhizobium sp.]